MNPKYQRLSQCSSQQNFSMPYFCPLSPYQKIATPLRVRVTSTPSGQASPITFLTAVNRDKSPSGKQNECMALNQSPITNRFSTKHRDTVNEMKKSPIMNMNKKVSSRAPNHNYHKSDLFQSSLQGTDSHNISCRNFEQGLYSLTENQPQGIKRSQKNIPKMKASNNFKSILQAQKYQIKEKDTRNLNPPGLLKKSSISNQQEKLFSSCFQNIQKQAINKRLPNKKKSTLLCMNDDGNIAKYITIATQDDDERLYYCSKCTVLLVNQGFVLQEIQNQAQIKETPVSTNFSDNYKIQACKDKLGSLINDLSMRQQFQLAKVTQFYDSLLQVLEKCKIKKQEQIKNLYEQKIAQYEEILAQLKAQSTKFQQNQLKFTSFEELYEEIMKFNLGQPFLKRYGNQQLNKIQESFSESLQNEFNLNFLIKVNQQQPQSINNRNHGLRFSFQKLLNDISSKKNKMQKIINSLQQQQQEEDSQSIQVQGEMNQKTAFRDLFPEAEDICQINSSVNSPTFKNF